MRKPYAAICGVSAEIGLDAIQQASDHPAAPVGQNRGFGVVRIKATGGEVAVVLRKNCTGGKFASESNPNNPGEDCPLGDDGICPAACGPDDYAYLNHLRGKANPGATIKHYARDEIESIGGEL